MPHTITRLVYNFDELNDAAKEKARQWFRDASAQDQFWDFIYEDAETVGKILGIEIDSKAIQTVGGKTRHEPAIYFSGFYSQGDGASFEGRYSYAKGAAKKVRKHTGNSDPALNAIADGLQAIQKEHGYRLEARVKSSGHGCASYNTAIDVTDSKTGDNADAETEKAVTDLLRQFMDWIYCQLRKEDEYRNADEHVDESIRANEYEFCESGERSRC